MNTTQHTREPPKGTTEQNRITLKINIMKTTHYFTILLALLSLTSFAQLDKKTWLVGGNVSFDSYRKKQHFYIGDISNPSTQEETSKNSNFIINAKMGFFVIDKLALGISPSYSYLRSKNVNSALPASHFSTLSIGPFARYYFLEKDKPFNVFADASYQFGYLMVKGDNTLKASATRFTAMAGVEFFFNDSAGIEFLAGYNQFKQNGAREIYGTITPYEDIGFKIAIGFQLHLFKEK